jgi:hypothetical protein
MGAFYFRKPEYDYFLKENAYLFGTDLRGFWDWYFKGVTDACSFCALPPHQCSCEHFEDGKPAPVKNPSWWKQVSTAKVHDARIDIDEWAKALIAMRDARRPDADAPRS